MLPNTRSDIMWLRLLLVVLHFIGAKAFALAPIRWVGLTGRTFILVPRSPPHVAVPTTSAAQKLTLWDERDITSLEKIPRFTAKPDNTISWDAAGLCIEASGDAVRIDRCTGEPRQSWTFLPSVYGQHHRIQLKDTNRCIDVTDKGRGLNGASIGLRRCEDQATESWILEDPALLPAGSRTAFGGHAMASSLLFLLLGGSALGSWFWRRRMHILAMSQPVPPHADLGGISLVSPLTMCQSSAVLAPNLSDVQRIAPAVMADRPVSQLPVTDKASGDNFDLNTAVLAAGFAFEVYNQPSENDARWERGADGINVAFMSEDFVREVYDGILEVRLREVKDLEEQKDLGQKLVSGGQRDPYAIFALNEENDEGPKEGAIGLGRAVDTVRTSTVWSKSLVDQWRSGGNKDKKGHITWPEDERLYLYVKDPNRAQLALTAFDEEVLSQDIALGATSMHLADLIKPEGGEWSGWVKLTWRPEETRDNAVLAGATAGAWLGGPVGAAAGAFIGSMAKKPVQGELFIELRYTSFKFTSTPVLQPAGTGPAQMSDEGKGVSTDVDGDGNDTTEEAKLILASGSAPKGGSVGIDWSILAKRVGVIGDQGVDGYELCCFLDHEATSCQVAIWRQRSTRLLVVSFRGTSDIIDVLTDAKIFQTPLEQGYKDQKSDDPRLVHSGFFASAQAINRRLKELLVAACAGTPGEWQLLITGHSLGGAVAILMAPELVGKVDTTRGFKERDDASWWGIASKSVQGLFSSASEVFGGGEMPRLGKVQLYTFGAPRVGNSDFARYFEDTFKGEAFRIVNDRDIVARLPRDSRAAGAVLDYEHCGRTVLIAETTAEASGFDGFWIEGSSDDAVCPLRDVSPFSNPFSSGRALGDVSKEAADFATTAWKKIDEASKVKSRDQFQQAFKESTAEFGRVRETIASRIKQIADNPLEAVSLIGMDERFVQSELQLIESFTSGKAIINHLEPSYFVAMTKALDAVLNENTAEGTTPKA